MVPVQSLNKQNLYLTKTVLFQSYFTFSDMYVKSPKNIVTGSPISSTIAEIFLQYLEDGLIKHHLETRNIIVYIHVRSMLSELWLIVFLLLPTWIYTQYITLKPAYVINNQIIFLDLLLRNDFAIETDIFQTSTTTDTSINSLSYHSMKQISRV
jgi:hypothetical protein